MNHLNAFWLHMVLTEEQLPITNCASEQIAISDVKPGYTPGTHTTIVRSLGKHI